jgi:hypothetical protein
MKTTWIKSTGECVDVKPKNGKVFTLNELKKFVNGWIEIVPLYDGSKHNGYMVVNEEGKLYNLPQNEVATAMFVLFANRGRDVIVGDVLVCNVDEIE